MVLYKGSTGAGVGCNKARARGIKERLTGDIITPRATTTPSFPPKKVKTQDNKTSVPLLSNLILDPTATVL